MAGRAFLGRHWRSVVGASLPLLLVLLVLLGGLDAYLLLDDLVSGLFVVAVLFGLFVSLVQIAVRR